MRNQLVRKVTSEQALALVYEEKALVNTISSDLNDNSSWEYILNQHKDPQNFRPVKALSQQADRSIYYDPRNGNWNRRHLKITRGGFKATDMTKKKSTSLLPADGQMTLYLGKDRRIGLMYNLDQCYLKDGKYIFKKNEVTNSKWWIQGQEHDYKKVPILPRSVTIETIRQQNRNARAKGEIPEWNEILSCTTTASMSAVFAPVDDLATRLNALWKKLYVLNELQIDLPVLLITSNAPARAYLVRAQAIDIINALTEQNTAARNIVNLIFKNDLDEVVNFIISNLDNDGVSEIFNVAMGNRQWELAHLLYDNYKEIHLCFKQSNTGYTALHYAVIGSQADLVEKFCIQGASIKDKASKSRQYRTPLAIANYNKDIILIKTLLQYGQDFDPADLANTLCIAASLHEWNLLYDVLYLCPNISLDHPDSYLGYTALHYAVINEEQAIMEVLCQKGASILSKANPVRQGRTPLSIALYNKKLFLVESLLKNTVLSETPSASCLGEILLLSAVHQNWGLMHFVMHKFIEIDVSLCETKSGRTALHYAVTYQQLGLAENLCLRGADIFKERKNSKGTSRSRFKNKKRENLKSPLQLAFGNKDTDMAKVLLENMTLASIEDEHEAIMFAVQYKIINVLIAIHFDKLEDINGFIATVSNPETFEQALLLAAYYNKTDMALALITCCIDVNRCSFHGSGNRALHYAVLNNDPILTAELCRKGAELCLLNKKGQSALDLAITEKDFPLIGTLLKECLFIDSYLVGAKERALHSNDNYKEFPKLYNFLKLVKDFSIDKLGQRAYLDRHSYLQQGMEAIKTKIFEFYDDKKSLEKTYQHVHELFEEFKKLDAKIINALNAIHEIPIDYKETSRAKAFSAMITHISSYYIKDDIEFKKRIKLLDSEYRDFIDLDKKIQEIYNTFKDYNANNIFIKGAVTSILSAIKDAYLQCTVGQITPNVCYENFRLTLFGILKLTKSHYKSFGVVTKISFFDRAKIKEEILDFIRKLDIELNPIPSQCLKPCSLPDKTTSFEDRHGTFYQSKSGKRVTAKEIQKYCYHGIFSNKLTLKDKIYMEGEEDIVYRARLLFFDLGYAVYTDESRDEQFRFEPTLIDYLALLKMKTELKLTF